jgi:DNA excision repair protein ERCC-4
VNLSSKLVLLNLHFPQLRIIWSSSPLATAEIFEALKQKQPEPDIQKAAKMGLSLTDMKNVYHLVPKEVLQRFPGITEDNYRHILNHVKNIQALADLSFIHLSELIGKKSAQILIEFINKDTKKPYAEYGPLLNS